MEVSQQKNSVTSDYVDDLVRNRRPTMDAAGDSILELIHDDIKIDAPPYQTDLLSPTPLDGEHLIIMGQPYVETSLEYMKECIYERLGELGIKLHDYQDGAIMESIHIEHRERVAHGMASLRRIQAAYLLGTTSISNEEAQVVYRARSAEATQPELINLLVAHPEIEGIEDSKYTKPLDPIAVAAAMRDVHSRTRRIRFDNPDFKIRVLSEKEQRKRRRFVQLGDLSQFGIMATKKPLIEATYQGVTIVKKMRESMIMLPEYQYLGDNPPMIRMIKGVAANIQPIGFTTYWSIDKTAQNT